MWGSRLLFDLLLHRVRAAEVLEREVVVAKNNEDLLNTALETANRDLAYWRGRAVSLEAANNHWRDLHADAEARAAANRASGLEVAVALKASETAHKVTIAHFEWLQVMFNRESTERALISHAKIGVALPPMTVGKQPAGEPGPTRGFASSENFDDSPEPPPGVEGTPATGTGDDIDDEGLAGLEAEVGASMFEDAGDAKAKKLGARHEDDGSLVFDK